jgi:hypothetical protein
MQKVHGLSIIHGSKMTRRRKGQIPYESAHPTRPEMPDVPGHQQRRGIVVNKDQKRELEKQLENLGKELGIPVGNPENKG